MTFEEFYKENYLRLYRIAISIVHDDEESRDLVAETFKKLWLVWEECKEPLAMAQKILRNVCISHIRHKSVHECFKQRIVNEGYLLHTADNMHEKRVELLRRHIETLGSEDKLIIKYIIFEKRTFKDVAMAMDCSYSLARRKFAQLLQRLKEYISQKEEL